jgi:hypothetical protein
LDGRCNRPVALVPDDEAEALPEAETVARSPMIRDSSDIVLLANGARTNCDSGIFACGGKGRERIALITNRARAQDSLLDSAGIAADAFQVGGIGLGATIRQG